MMSLGVAPSWFARFRAAISDVFTRGPVHADVKISINRQYWTDYWIGVRAVDERVELLFNGDESPTVLDHFEARKIGDALMSAANTVENYLKGKGSNQ
jgi:hypothetical protein